MGKMIFKSLLFFLLLTLASCDSIKSFTNSTMEFFGFSKVKTEKKVTQKKTKKSNPATEKIQPKEKPEPKIEVVITDKPKNKKTEKAETQTKESQPKMTDSDIPVAITKRIGGVATKILADPDTLYLNFSQSLDLYDSHLKFITSKRIPFPIVAVKKIIFGEKTFFLFKEKNHVLEITELVADNTNKELPYLLKEIVSYDMEAPFFWIDDKTLVTAFPDETRLYDLTPIFGAGNVDEIPEIKKLPFGEINDVVQLGNFLYLAHKNSLEIFDLQKNEHTSSIQISHPFAFLMNEDLKAKKQIALSLFNNKRDLVGVQILELAPDFSKAQKFVVNQILPSPLHEFRIDKNTGLIAGQDEIEKNKLQLYSLKEGRYLRGELPTQKNAMSWDLADNKLYLVSPQEISINQIKSEASVIQNTNTVNQEGAQESSSVPLAQIGIKNKLKDEYSLTKITSLNYKADAKKVFLLDKNHFLMFENVTDDSPYRILASDNFSADDFTLQSPTAPALRFDKFKLTDFGLLAYHENSGVLSLLDVNLKGFQTLPLIGEGLYAFEHFSTEGGEILITASEIKTQTTESTNLSYKIKIHLLESPQKIQLLSELDFKEKVFVLFNHEKEILVISPTDIQTFSTENLKEPTLKENKKLSFEKPYKILSCKLLQLDFTDTFEIDDIRLIALIEEDGQNKILVHSLLKPENKITLDDFKINLNHFEGLTFAAGGQLMILPSPQGTLFYDLTDLTASSKDYLVALWPEPSEHASMADDRFLCVALGPKGVYCGDLLFK